MKILHVCSNYYPAHGGPQYTMKHLSEKMAAWYGDEVTVATSNSFFGPEQPVFKKIELPVETFNGVLIKRFPLIRWHYPLLETAGKLYKKMIGRSLPHRIRKHRWEMHSPGVLREMKETDVDVIMATTINYTFSDYPLWRFRTGNAKPFILYGALHLHVKWRKDSEMMRRARICDCYIANTEYERERLIEYGVMPENIVTIGTGIEINEMLAEASDVKGFREAHGIVDDDVLIGHIGRLSEGKGVGIVLEAFIALYNNNKNAKLLLAGTSTGYEQVLKNRAKEKNVPVIFLDDFSDSQKPVLFNALDVFVLASEGESFGVVFLEAWACKKPVIGARSGAVSTLLSDGKDGLLFEPGNAASLEQKFAELVGSPQKRTMFGNNGFMKIAEHYTWPIIVEKYRLAYEKAIKNFKGKKQGTTP